MSTTRILLIGASGRMGREVAQAVRRANQDGAQFRIVGGIIDEADADLGGRLPDIDAALSSDWVEEYSAANVIIDFSGPGGTKKALAIAKTRKIPLLICTTGLSDTLRAEAAAVSKTVPVIIASNTSIGVNAMLKLVQDATAMLGERFDVEISEIHHKHKKDAPSGTAISLGESVARARGVKLGTIAVEGRAGAEALRKSGELGLSAIRGGDIVGEHTVYYFGNGERLEITHRATNRGIFADGALRAAAWLVSQAEKGGAPGHYTMQDVLSGR